MGFEHMVSLVTTDTKKLSWNGKLFVYVYSDITTYTLLAKDHLNKHKIHKMRMKPTFSILNTNTAKQVERYGNSMKF